MCVCLGGGKIVKSLMAALLLFATAVQNATADDKRTLEACDTLPGQYNGPEHIYTIYNNQSQCLFWKEDLLPTQSTTQDVGTFAFYKVEGKDNAYYIYDCSMGQWLTYEVKDDYGKADKGTGQKNYIKLVNTKDSASSFVITEKNNGYEIRLVDTKGELPSTPWYLNYYGGYKDYGNNTIGIWWHDGGKDDGSLWFLGTPHSTEQIAVATTEPDKAGDRRLENVFTMHNGYNAGVGRDMKPTAEDDGHFVFYQVDGIKDAYYIYDYSKGKWLTYDKKESYKTGTGDYGEKDFVQLSDTMGNYFYITSCATRGVTGYQIQPYTTSGAAALVYLNYYTGAHLNKTNTLGFYTHDGNRDSGSLWKLDATDPHEKPISEEGTNSKFDYLGDVNISLTRTLKAGVWNTFCVPFNISAARITSVFGEGCKVREFTSVEDEDGKNTLVFSEAKAIEAGKPYLVNPDRDIQNPTFQYATLLEQTAQSVEKDGYSMVGTYGQATLTTDGTNLFLTASNRFKKPKDAQDKHNVLKGLRAYFVVPNGTNEAKMYALIDGEPTAIEDIDSDGPAQEKSAIYNIQGQYMGTNLEKLGRGVYIQNGKKFIVK